MNTQDRIQKNILKDLTGIEWTILRALIDLYPEYRVFDPQHPEPFGMILPKDLHLHIGLKLGAFHSFVNGLAEKKFLHSKWLSVRGIAVGINFAKIQEYADGVPGVMTWRRRLKKAISAISQFFRRGSTRKPK